MSTENHADDLDIPLIADRMAWHRKECEGLTQAEYAERAGLKRTQYNNWEKGTQRLSLSGAMKLRAEFGLSLDFLFFGTIETLPAHLYRRWRETHPDAN